jgi:hypothetical protein
VARQDPVDRALGGHHRHTAGLEQLHPYPFGTPAWMLAPRLHHHDLNTNVTPMRAPVRTPRPIHQTGHTPSQIPAQPAMKRLPRHPDPGRHLGHRRAGQHQPLLNHRQTQPTPISTSPSPTPPRGHRTQVAEQRPVSSVNWHRTVKHLLAQDNGRRPGV